MKKNESSNKKIHLVKKSILGISVTNALANEVLEYIFNTIVNTKENFYIVTPNPEMVVRAQSDKKFRDIINQAEISLCDGSGLYLASKILQQRVKERISGLDFMKKICEKSLNQPVRIGFLGGRDGVADRTAHRLRQDYPGLKVVFVGEEWNENKLKIDILFLAFGVPKQEFWMAEHISKIPVRVTMGIGGAFDEIAGIVSPCPALIDRVGFKWLWRLVHEPWRWRRQLALLEFILLVLKSRLTESSRGSSPRMRTKKQAKG